MNNTIILKSKLFLVSLFFIYGRMQASILKDPSFFIPALIVCSPSIATAVVCGTSYMKKPVQLFVNNPKKYIKKGVFRTIKGAYKAACAAGNGMVVLDEGIQTVIDYGATKVPKMPSIPGFVTIKKESGPLCIGAATAAACGYLYSEALKTVAPTTKYGLLSALGLAQYVYTRKAAEKDLLVDSLNWQLSLKTYKDRVKLDEDFANSDAGRRLEPVRRQSLFLYNISKRCCMYLQSLEKKNLSSENVKTDKKKKVFNFLLKNGPSYIVHGFVRGCGYSRTVSWFAGFITRDIVNTRLNAYKVVKKEYDTITTKSDSKISLLPLTFDAALHTALICGVATKCNSIDLGGMLCVGTVAALHSYHKHTIYSYAEIVSQIMKNPSPYKKPKGEKK